MLSACDIHKQACQRDVAKIMACWRGDEPAQVPVDVVDAERFIAGKLSELDADPMSDGELTRLKALSLLRLMPKELSAQGVVRNKWKSVAAFYDSDSRRITVLDRGERLDEYVALLAHEFVHALQDHDEGRVFTSESDHSRDAELASAAMVEGEASLYQQLAWTAALGWKPSDIDWSQVFDQAKASAWSFALREESIYQRSRSHFAYVFGASYLSPAYFQAGPVEVRRVLDDLPTSTRRAMADYASQAPEFGWAEPLGDQAVPMLPGEYHLLTTDRMGAWLFANFLARWSGDGEPPAGELSASGWSGDSLSIFQSDAGNLSIFWRVRFEQPSLARQARAHLKLDDELFVKQEQRDLVFAANSGDESWSDLIASTLSWTAGPPPDSEADSARIARDGLVLCSPNKTLVSTH
jgi:hypothetical protein